MIRHCDNPPTAQLRLAYAHIRAACQATLDGYTTTMEQDKAWAEEGGVAAQSTASSEDRSRASLPTMQDGAAPAPPPAPPPATQKKGRGRTKKKRGAQSNSTARLLVPLQPITEQEQRARAAALRPLLAGVRVGERQILYQHVFQLGQALRG